MRSISYILLFIAGCLATVGAVVYFSSESKRDKVLDSLEKARKAKAKKAQEKAYLESIQDTEFQKDLEDEIKSLENSNNESDGSKTQKE